MNKDTHTTHTPGPWKLITQVLSAPPEPDCYIVVDAAEHYATICKIKSPCSALAPQAAANARLITAAPELLDSLKLVLADLEHYAATHGPGPDVRLAAARAAIAKAEGSAE